jgi:hypothetical protein
MKTFVRSISVVTVALVWIFVAGSIFRAVAPLFERLFLNRASSFDDAIGPVLGWVLVAALLLGCLTAWHVTQAEPFDAEARALRSVLSVWPGWPLAIVGIIIAAAALILKGLPASTIQISTRYVLDDYVFATVPLTLAAAAAATGGRSKGALLAAPMTLVLAVGLVAEISIVRTAAAACVPAALLAIGFAALASVTGRELLVWLAIGFAAVAVLGLALATGMFTPTELLGVVSLLAIPIGLLVYSLNEGAFAWRMFSIGATEILAAVSVLVFARLGSTLAAFYGILPGPPAAPVAAGLELAAGAAMLAASFVLTPMLAISLVGIVFFPMFGQANMRVGILFVLAGVAAMILRSIDWTHGIEAASLLRLSPSIGLVAVAMLLAVTALTLTFWPAIETQLRLFVG